jgi:hypothetical protein
MLTSGLEQDVQIVNVAREIGIAAPLAIAFEAILEELGPSSELPNGTTFPMVIEPWPGGRWYRDLGDGAGHLWGHVQVIKPPTLLEVWGPMFMSFPAVNHVQYRLTEEGEGTRLSFLHRAMGPIPEEFRAKFGVGWEFRLGRIAEIASRLNSERRAE